MNCCCLYVQSREVQRRGGVQRIMLQPWETRSVSVAYTASEHKPVTSILLLRYVHEQVN